MSKTRGINTRFWADTWVREDLNPLDRYLFLYFLTNEHTNIGGIYEMPLGTIAFESGIDKEDLTKSMLKRLAPKLFYYKGWVIIPNFPKHQNLKSEDVIKGIKREFDAAPAEVQKEALRRGWGDGLGMVYTSPEVLNSTKPNLSEGKKSKDFSASLKEVQLDSEGKEKQPKQKRDMAAWHLRDKLYDIFDDALGVRPTPHTGDYTMGIAALKVLNEDEILDMVQEQLAGKKPPRTVREALSARQVDIYRQENI